MTKLFLFWLITGAFASTVPNAVPGILGSIDYEDKGLYASECELRKNGDIEVKFEEPQLNFTITHRLFQTELLVEGITYQVRLTPSNGPNNIIEFILTSLVNGSPRGQFSINKNISNGEICPPSSMSAVRGINELFANWSLPATNIDRSNLTFRLWYRKEDSPSTFEILYTFYVIRDCNLHLHPDESKDLSWTDLPLRYQDCQIHFTKHTTDYGLVINLNRLNVPCSRGGYLQFFSTSISSGDPSTNTFTHYKNRLCGKLEELSDTDRHIYFPAEILPLLHLQGGPKFSLNYNLVDHCFSVTLNALNGTFEIRSNRLLECTYKIHVPYGYRIALHLLTGSMSANDSKFFDGRRECSGLQVKLEYAGLSEPLYHCASNNDFESVHTVVPSNRLSLSVKVLEISADLKLKVWYNAEPIEEVVKQCAYGSTAFRQFCITVVENTKMSWSQAESECVRRGGHLVSIRNELMQQHIDNLLLNSPGYHDHNAYWIGASDRTYEGDFRWTDSLTFSYTNWFPGWSQHNYYNRQPNDDGLSDQDCVEVRRAYHLPNSSSRVTTSFYWNDRDCSTTNYFICERLLSEEPVEDLWQLTCNKTVTLTRQQPRNHVTSPGFPKQYPDNAHCEIDILSPLGYRIVLDFDELVLENETHCSYDFLEIVEVSKGGAPSHKEGTITIASTGSSVMITEQPPLNNKVMTAPPTTTTIPVGNNQERLCGDWSTKLKLLRYVSDSSHLKIRFVSDYSRHFGGFKATVSMENVMECSDERLILFNNSCYLFVSYPEVTWSTAQQICKGVKAELVSIKSSEEQQFITSNIRKTIEYKPNTIYWIGSKVTLNGKHEWNDGTSTSFNGFLPGVSPIRLMQKYSNVTSACLGIQWTPSKSPLVSSGLYWNVQKCSATGGYVCKRPRNSLTIHDGINLNKTINGSEGRLTSLNYPGNYYNNLDYWVKITAPERTRVVVQFSKLDVEYQAECLYDYVGLESVPVDEDSVRWCGTHDTDMEQFNFVSKTNEVLLSFHSDYSTTGIGFSITWQAIDVSSCPEQTLTAQEGAIISPNYPYFLLSRLNCTVKILAPTGRHIWLEITEYDIDDTNEAMLSLDLGDKRIFNPFKFPRHINDGAFISIGEKIEIRLQTLRYPYGAGFRATYKALSNNREDRVVQISNTTFGPILHLNYPLEPPKNMDYIQHFVAPLGNVILLELFHVRFSEDKTCPENEGSIEVYDNYADQDGTTWFLCLEPPKNPSIPNSPISITSYLNTIHIRQISTSVGIPLNGTIRAQIDVNYKIKLLRFEDTNSVESCRPNPCQNSGRCMSNGKRNVCRCHGHFTGLFCALTMCEVEPCVFGRCELTKQGYRCHCNPGYTGITCEQKQKPCETNPCEGRGDCIDRGETYHCRCHAWWEGSRCERRMMNIPFRPLSERMLHEPFWLGLITVTIVLGFIGLVWCAKRHFPEKLEKLLAEEADRNRSSSTLRGSSLREQLASSGGGTPTAVMVMPSPQQGGCPRSLFGRLGIRKPSLLSLTSPHGSSHGHPSTAATARTFSLDDLLKPPPRRTPSPRKKRNNSTPTKKNAAEKKQILQQLISPAPQNRARKVNLGELIQLSERKVNEAAQNDSTNEPSCSETNFSVKAEPQDDPKLEKKVTFARLLNKVSAEMSSSSEIELNYMKERVKVAVRPASTPPSPAAADMRSPHSTSSNQGSDSFSSLEIPGAGDIGSITDMLNHRRNSRRAEIGGKVKPASADSILAMFRNFSSTSAAANLSSSLLASPSTTPTASSPQDDVAGDDDSSTSSIATPISFSSNAPDSPSIHHIEVSVLDPQRSIASSNLLQPPTILLEIPSQINKCLSPIHEMPTPMPSPAPTPMRQRSPPLYSSDDDAGLDSEDRISIEIPGMSLSISDGDDDLPQDIVIDLQAEDGLLQEEAAAMTIASLPVPVKTVKGRNPPIGQGVTAITIKPLPKLNEPGPSTPLIIPTLTIQQPSPTHRNPPVMLFVGSPPPQRAFITAEDSFLPTRNQQKRGLLKDFDKPTSLDLPCAPPMITITCNLSEAESDTESISPAVKNTNLGSSNMCYLSPFSMGSRNDRTTSESNLSSSGYSSMASPGPSRCGSNNPLCEMEDPGPGPTPRRPSSLLKTEEPVRRSDSETLSDDQLLESNDEGIGTDHIDDKIEDGELKSAKELEIFMDVDTLKLPAIYVQDDVRLSPVSSRSESPLSDKTSGRYAQYRKDLSYTDSDGLYDLTSSDLQNSKVNLSATGQQHRKSIGRRRDKKMIKSPTKHTSLLDIPGKEAIRTKTPLRKSSPKRRIRSQQRVSSSSSSESLHSTKEMKVSSSSPSPDTIRWPGEWDKKSKEDTVLDLSAEILKKSLPDELPKSVRKISRLRTISHQIRFLRRLEQSLKQRDRLSDSGGEEDDDRTTVTSPLLHSPKGSRPEIRKSSSIGKLQGVSSHYMRRPRGSPLLTAPDDRLKWTRVPGNGFSD